MKATSRLAIATFAVITAAGAGHWRGTIERERREPPTRLASNSPSIVRPPETTRLTAARKQLPEFTAKLLRWDDWQARADIERLLKDLNAGELDILARDLDPATPGDNGRTALSMIFGQLARTDRELAKAFLRDLSTEIKTPPLYESSVLKSLLITLSILEPRGALELADTWGEQHQEIRQFLSDTALEHLAEIDLDTFRTRFAALDDTRRSRILRNLSDFDETRTTLAEVLRLSSTLPPEAMEEVRAQLVEVIAIQNPVEALRLLQTWELPENIRRTADTSMTAVLLRDATDDDSRRVLDGYLQRNPERQDWSPLECPLQSWCERSPTTYVDWLDSLPDGPQRDAAAAAAARSGIWLPQAQAFADAIGDPTLRTEVGHRLTRRQELEGP
ncbi:hypothetical protein [Luteolibacter sp. LG18]|uniref:hypothetical protein n=1 Tax=Luteolibacter sp. LG18 TaxID=2819286 RepID=UPI002B2B8A61|nr:hypothetical protein llg_28730 [Luteolibacter sp. LG18]